MAIPSVPLSVLQETVARAISRYPEQKGRIERGATLITLGHVDHLIADLFAIKSQTDDTTYIVDSTGCPCIDAKRHPELTCKHQWSVTLLLVAQERARRRAKQATALQATSLDLRAYLAQLIEQRTQRGRVVAAEGGRAVVDPECVKLDEHIARLRASLAPVSFREAVAA